MGCKLLKKWGLQFTCRDFHVHFVCAFCGWGGVSLVSFKICAVCLLQNLTHSPLHCPLPGLLWVAARLAWKSPFWVSSPSGTIHLSCREALRLFAGLLKRKMYWHYREQLTWYLGHSETQVSEWLMVESPMVHNCLCPASCLSAVI